MRSSINNGDGGRYGGNYSGEDRLEKPYQIYSEMVNTGKTIGGTKRRIKWRFGWSNSSETHEVELVHSLVSGKKVTMM
jgi:hypothetical protein